MIVVFFAGKARVGKTTAANHLAKFAKKNDMNPVIVPFAKAIKDAAVAAGLSKDADPKAYRDYCQKIGAQRRAEDQDYWVKAFASTLMDLQLKDMEKMNDPEAFWKETVVIVDDCRYLNEINFGRTIGATVMFVSAGDRKLEDHEAEWRNHESEEVANKNDSGDKDYKDMFQWWINNDSSEKKFLEKLTDRFPIMLGLTPHSWSDQCDCAGCQAFYKDNKLSLEDLFDGLG